MIAQKQLGGHLMVTCWSMILVDFRRTKFVNYTKRERILYSALAKGSVFFFDVRGLVEQ